MASKYRDSSGKKLTDYPRPSVAVDTAVLSVDADRRGLGVLLVRREDGEREPYWALPGTFLHKGEWLADAVLRSLAEKAGIRGTTPVQLGVFDDPVRDSRGWVLSVAHVVVVPWVVVGEAVAARPDDVAFRPVDQVRGLLFDHDTIVQRAVERVRAEHAERPDPAVLVPEPFTLRQLRHLHEAVAGVPASSADTFRRHVLPHLAEVPGALSEGTVGKPAQLYRRR